MKKNRKPARMIRTLFLPSQEPLGLRRKQIPESRGRPGLVERRGIEKKEERRQKTKKKKLTLSKQSA